MRLFATSKGIFTHEEMVPDIRPIVNFLRNSNVGSCLEDKVETYYLDKQNFPYLTVSLESFI